MKVPQVKLFSVALALSLLPIGFEHAVPELMDYLASRSIDGSDEAIPHKLYRRMRQKLTDETPESVDAEFRALRVDRRLFSDGRTTDVICGEYRLPGDNHFHLLVFIDRPEFKLIPSTLAEAFPVRNRETAPIILRELKYWAIAERVGCAEARDLQRVLSNTVSASDPKQPRETALLGANTDQW